MRKLLKEIFSKVQVDTYQRLLAYSILKHEYNDISSCSQYTSREHLWETVVKLLQKTGSKLTYVEFGVHEGYSIDYFANQNKDEESIFIGLDSFEGLPEDWGTMKKGAFDKGGAIPNSADSRITYIKGWFQNSWENLNQRLSIADLENLIVHYDADLYSSTLFALTKIDTLKKPYLAIFDEFTGHESRALFNYCQAYNAKVEFLGKTIVDGYPFSVACRIIPNSV